MAALLERGLERFHTLRKSLHDRYNDLPRGGKITVWVYFGVHVFVGLAVWIIGPTRLMDWMGDMGRGLREMEWGWAVLLTMIIITSFPPTFGYGTCIMLCGFGFGVWKGWLLGVAGCLLGSLASFVVTRQLVGVFAPMLKQDKTFRALATAVRSKGLPLVVLIRLCPFPFTYSNAFFASIESVSLFHFLVATLAITPKLFLHVWVGSRMFLFADPESRAHMDSQSKILNGIYVGLGSALGAGTSYYVYKLTMKYVDEIVFDDEGGDPEEAAGLIDDVDAMLDEDDEAAGRDSDDLPTPRGNPGPSIPLVHVPALAHTISYSSTKSAKPTPPPLVPYSDERPSLDESLRKSARGSEEWEGAFSDFDEGPEEREEDIGEVEVEQEEDPWKQEEEEDPFGLGLATPRPGVMRTSSSSATITDKLRRD